MKSILVPDSWVTGSIQGVLERWFAAPLKSNNCSFKLGHYNILYTNYYGMAFLLYRKRGGSFIGFCSIPAMSWLVLGSNSSSLCYIPRAVSTLSIRAIASQVLPTTQHNCMLLTKISKIVTLDSAVLYFTNSDSSSSDLNPHNFVTKLDSPSPGTKNRVVAQNQNRGRL
jgi:hypothetical protein